LASTTRTGRTPPDGAPGPAPGLAADDEADGADAAPRLLRVRVAGRSYGVPLDVVREVLVAGPTTRLPGAPPHVLGLRNVRGGLVTVLDVARRLHPDAPPADGGHVLLVETGGATAGCRVDAVLRAAPGELPSPPREDGGNAAVGGIVLGLGEVEGEPVVVLDLPRFVRETLLDPGER
jgi:chemotaxis signal transduction protein